MAARAATVPAPSANADVRKAILDACATINQECQRLEKVRLKQVKKKAA